MTLEALIKQQFTDTNARMLSSLSDAQIPEQYHGILKCMIREYMALAVIQQEERSVLPVPTEPKFPMVYCSSCGQGFGPGDHGFSHCGNHKHLPVIED